MCCCSEHSRQQSLDIFHKWVNLVAILSKALNVEMNCQRWMDLAVLLRLWLAFWIENECICIEKFQDKVKMGMIVLILDFCVALPSGQISVDCYSCMCNHSRDSQSASLPPSLLFLFYFSHSLSVSQFVFYPRAGVRDFKDTSACSLAASTLWILILYQSHSLWCLSSGIQRENWPCWLPWTEG